MQNDFAIHCFMIDASLTTWQWTALSFLASERERMQVCPFTSLGQFGQERETKNLW